MENIIKSITEIFQTLNFSVAVVWALIWVIILLVIGKVSFAAAIGRGIFFLIYWIIFSIIFIFVCKTFGWCLNKLDINSINN